jgi:hypothetical protein
MATKTKSGQMLLRFETFRSTAFVELRLYRESYLVNSLRSAIVLACPPRESFAKLICSSSAARSSRTIRSTSACVLTSRATVESCWIRASV